jgi:hypothetical protein
MGDGWEHVLLIERTMTEAEVRKALPKYKGGAVVTGGSGHGVAEDAGGPPGWEDLKDAYAVKGTKQDDGEAKERRHWYEHMCGKNGDRAGLKGKAKLERLDVAEANAMYRALQRYMP